MLMAYEDKSAYAQCVFSYSLGPVVAADGSVTIATPEVFVGRTHGKIVPARGPPDFG